MKQIISLKLYEMLRMEIKKSHWNLNKVIAIFLVKF